MPQIISTSHFSNSRWEKKNHDALVVYFAYGYLDIQSISYHSFGLPCKISPIMPQNFVVQSDRVSLMMIRIMHNISLRLYDRSNRKAKTAILLKLL